MPIWAKAIFWIAETVAQGLLWQQFQYGNEIAPTGGTSVDAPATQWRRFVVRASDTISLAPQDDLITTFDIVNITNGNVDNSWTDADHDKVATAFNAYLTSYSNHMQDRYLFDRLEAYAMAYRPYSDSKPFAISGPPVRVWPMGVPGVSVGYQAPQVRSTVTEMTPSRRHWGRAFMPGIECVPGADGKAGRLPSAVVDALCASAEAFYEQLAGDEFYGVVPVTQFDKRPTRALQAITGVRVDDVYDVIRRGRHRQALHTASLPTPTP